MLTSAFLGHGGRTPDLDGDEDDGECVARFIFS